MLNLLLRAKTKKGAIGAFFVYCDPDTTYEPRRATTVSTAGECSISSGQSPR